MLTRLLRESVTMPLRVAAGATRGASALTMRSVQTAATATGGVASAGIDVAFTTVRRLGDAAGLVAGEFTRGTASRRSWRGGDYSWIEVRGLHHPEAGALIADTVLAALTRYPGVTSAELNHPLSRVVVRVHSARPDLAQLCEVVDTAEAAARRSAGVHRDCPTDLPADAVVRADRVAAVTFNAIGLVAAAAGRAMWWPRLPAGVAAAMTVIDYQPRLRHLVENRLGPSAADTALALAASTVYTLTMAPTSLVVELLANLAKTGEVAAAARRWEQQAPALGEQAACEPVPRQPRPIPRPHGPVERHADRSGLLQAIGATAIGLFTGDPTIAATAAVVAAPKAARVTRECFAATLGRGLADDHGVLVLRPEALRRLDRVDTVLIDPRALDTAEVKVGRIRGGSERQRVAAWQWAHDALSRRQLSPGWHRAPSGNGRRSGVQVLIRPVHHPLAAAVAGEGRTGGCEVVSLDVDTLDDLRSVFDDLYPASTDIDAALSDALHQLQANGRTVAVVSSAAAAALAAADVSIGLIGPEGPPWHAQLLVDDLAAAWRILRALPAARRASHRGVELATAATVLGAVLMVPGVRGRGPGPVTAGAAAGLFTGYRLAQSALHAAAPAPRFSQDWHAMSVDEVRGLLPRPNAEVSHNDESADGGGLAVLTGGVTRMRSWIWEFATAVRDELSDPLTPLLATGSATSALLGSPLDAALVGSVVAANSGMSAFQQVRAERLLRRMLAVQEPKAHVVQPDSVGGQVIASVDAKWLRPGDVIRVGPGEVVPADARLIEAADLEIDESSLTGESLPVSKQAEPTPGAALAERSCMIFAATTVVAGTADAVVTAVGAATEARRAAEVPAGHGSAVGLQTQLRELTNRAWPVSLSGGALVSGLSLLRLRGLRQALSSGVAVSVAAIPEGLPLVATLAQQASARRLTRMGVLVRAPRSVEALGRVDVVCFDKTGTLSENRLTVSAIRTVPGADADEVLCCAARATPPARGGRHDHATDRAVVEASSSLLIPAAPDTSYLPFRSGRPFSASLAGTELVLKGAPEAVLNNAATPDRNMAEQVEQMAAAGLRVIAVARRQVTAAQARAAARDSDALAELCGEQLHIVGLLGLSDTPRPEAAAVLAALAEQHVGIRLITGDHPVTATAIAAQLGMPVSGQQVISGAEWEALPRRGQEQAVTERLVFARMTPEHKVQIVQTLERLGRVCAMVGDGANDAAAIRAATVGVGVVSRGSDPARTAADVMLLDGRIEALLDAVDEGRQLWRRVQAAVSVLLGGNAGEVAFAIAGTAITGASPLNTRQLLLVNLLTDALPAAALAVSPVNGGGRESGRGPDQAALWRTVAERGATTAGGAFAAWLLARLTGRAGRASTVALVALVATQLGQTLLDSHSPLVVGTALGSMGALAAAVSTPGVSQLLGCTPLGPLGWTQALAMAGAATGVAAVAPRVGGVLGVRRDAGSIAREASTEVSHTESDALFPPPSGNGRAGVATAASDHAPSSVGVGEPTGSDQACSSASPSS